jgi:hypothetical protein
VNPFQIHGKHVVGLPGVRVADEVHRGSLSAWLNCEHIVYISVPAFWFHRTGGSGFYFEICHKYVVSREDNGDPMAVSFDLLVEFLLVYEEGGVDTIFSYVIETETCQEKYQ